MKPMSGKWDSGIGKLVRDQVGAPGGPGSWVSEYCGKEHHLLNVPLDSQVRCLQDLSCQLDVAMDTQCLLWFLSIDSHFSLQGK